MGCDRITSFCLRRKNKYCPLVSPTLIAGYLLTLSTIVAWTASAIAVQSLQRSVPDFQLSTYRFTLQLALCGFALKFNGKKLSFQKEKLPHFLLLCVVSLFYNVFFFAATALLPLAHAMACYSISTMLFIGLLTKILLKNNLGFGHGLSLFLASLGIMLVNQPWSTFSNGFVPHFMMKTNNISSIDFGLNNTTFVFASEQNQKGTISYINVSLVVAIGYGLANLAGLFEAVYFIVIGTSLADIDPFSQAFVVAVTNVPASLLIALYVEEFMLVTEVSEILLLIVHCFGATFDLICTNAAIQRINPSHVCLIQSFTVVVLLIIQYKFMDNGLSGHKNALEVIGSIVIMSAIALTTLTSVPEKPPVMFR